MSARRGPGPSARASAPTRTAFHPSVQCLAHRSASHRFLANHRFSGISRAFSRSGKTLCRPTQAHFVPVASHPETTHLTHLFSRNLPPPSPLQARIKIRDSLINFATPKPITNPPRPTLRGRSLTFTQKVPLYHLFHTSDTPAKRFSPAPAARGRPRPVLIAPHTFCKAAVPRSRKATPAAFLQNAKTGSNGFPALRTGLVCSAPLGAPNQRRRGHLRGQSRTFTQKVPLFNTCAAGF